jgi:hypothetical protein
VKKGGDGGSGGSGGKKVQKTKIFPPPPEFGGKRWENVACLRGIGLVFPLIFPPFPTGKKKSLLRGS